MARELSRRGLIIGGLGVAAVGVGATKLPARYYPDWYLDRQIGTTNEPEPSWSIPVDQALIDAERAELESRIQQATELWSEIPNGKGNTEEQGLRRSVGSAERALDEGDEPSEQSLQSLEWGFREAGRAIGGAQEITGEADADAFRDRFQALHDETNDRLEELSYRITDPASELPLYFRIERGFAPALWSVSIPEEFEDWSEQEPHDLWPEYLQMAHGVRVAEHATEAWVPQSDSTVGRSDLSTLADRFAQEYESLQNEMADVGTPVGGDGPHELATYWLRNALYATRSLRSEPLVVTRLVRAVQGVARLRALPETLESLPFGSGEAPAPLEVYEAERETAKSFRSALDQYDTRLFKLLAAYAADLHSFAITRSNVEDLSDRQQRAQAYALFVAAERTLEHIQESYSRVVGELEPASSR